MSCFKGVYALRFLQIAIQRNQKNDKKKWFGRALASILRVFAVLFPYKNDKKEQFMDYIDKKFSYWPQMTL